MRIGIDASCLPAQIAGAGRYICGLLSGLNEVDRENEYFVFLKSRDLHHFQHLGEQFNLVTITAKKRPQRIWWQYHRPRHLVERFQLDVWHATHYLLPKKIEGTRSLVTFHDMTFMLFPKLYPVAKRLFFKKVIQDAVRRADHIVSVSQSTYNDIRRIFGDQPNRLTKIYSGTEGKFPELADKQLFDHFKVKLGLTGPYILFVGTLEKRKNVHLLVAAFAKLVTRGFDKLQLCIAGQPGNASESIRQLVELHDLQDRVVFAGYLPDAELASLYKQAELFVYPSLYEGFGFPVLEAMSCGTPILTANNSALAEISGNPEIQLALDSTDKWADAIARVLSDQDFRQNIIKRGKEHASTFSWRSTAEQMVSIYTKKDAITAFHMNGKLNPAIMNGQTRLNGSAFPLPASLKKLPRLCGAILQTVAYSDLFDYPLQADEICQSLIAQKGTIDTVQKSLASEPVSRYVQHTNGFYFLKGKGNAIQNRLRRQAASRNLLTKNRRLLKVVCYFPFVEAVALSGAIAFKNSLPDDDIDLFIILNPERTWTVYFVLVLLLKLLGKRKLVCLNYLYAKRDLTLAERDFFVAHQIANLRPISGAAVLEAFLSSNSWVLDYLPQTAMTFPHNGEDMFAKLTSSIKSESAARAKNSLEKILGFGIFHLLEKNIYKKYSRRIRQQTAHLGNSVKVEPDEIKLFTNDHRAVTLERFAARLESLLEPTKTGNRKAEFENRES